MEVCMYNIDPENGESVLAPYLSGSCMYPMGGYRDGQMWHFVFAKSQAPRNQLVGGTNQSASSQNT
jgi:hypothetical protein